MVCATLGTSLTDSFPVGSLTRRGQRYPPKFAQAIADVSENAAKVCGTKGKHVGSLLVAAASMQDVVIGLVLWWSTHGITLLLV